MLRSVGIGSCEQEHVLRDVRAAREHLLSVDDPLVSVGLRTSHGRCDIGAGTGLREAQAADDFTTQDRRDHFLLQFFASKLDQRLSDHRCRALRMNRTASTLHLFGHHGRLEEPEPPPANLLGPGHEEQTGLGHRAIEGRIEAVEIVLVDALLFGDGMRLEEAPRLGPEAFGGFAEPKVRVDRSGLGKRNHLAAPSPVRSIDVALSRIPRRERPGHRAPVIELDIVLVAQPIAAMGMQGPMSGSRCIFGNPGVGECDPLARLRRAPCDRIDGAPDQHAASVERRDQLGERVGDRLKVADRSIELDALRRLGGRDLDRAAPQSAQGRRREQPPLFPHLLESRSRLCAAREDAARLCLRSRRLRSQREIPVGEAAGRDIDRAGRRNVGLAGNEFFSVETDDHGRRLAPERRQAAANSTASKRLVPMPPSDSGTRSPSAPPSTR